MGISEAARNILYTALTEVIGDANTETLLKAIPLYDYHKMATKADVAVLRSDLRADIAELRAKMIEWIEALRASNSRWMVALMLTIVGAMASLRLVG